MSDFNRRPFVLDPANDKAFNARQSLNRAAKAAPGLPPKTGAPFKPLVQAGRGLRMVGRVAKADGQDGFGVAKAYSPGTITVHQEQADLHGRKKAEASRRITAGMAAVPVGATIGGGAHLAAPHIAEMVHGKSKVADIATKRAKLVRNVSRGGLIGGGAIVAGGLGVAGHGAISRLHHGRKQNEAVENAQTARRSRNASVAKGDAPISRDAVRDRTKANLVGVNGVALGGTVAYGGVKLAHTAKEYGKLPDMHPKDLAHAKKFVHIGHGAAAAGVAGAVGAGVYATKKLQSANRKQKALDAEYTGSVAKRDAFGVSKADLPGDNRQAQMARTRRRVGLTTAGTGYLVTARAKDVAHPVADWATAAAKGKDSQRLMRSAARVDAVQRAATVGRRAKTIQTVASRGGVAALGGGLALAGEGALSDLHHRKSITRAHSTVREAIGKDPKKSVEKGWGSLAGSAMKAFKPVGAKLAAGAEGPVGPSLGARLKPLGPQLNQTIAPIKAKIAAGGLNPVANGKLTTAGVGYVAGAGGLAGGAMMRGRNNNVNKSVEDRVRAEILAKAFDSERSRHGRQAAYTGGLAGGAVVAGGVGVKTGLDGRKATKAMVPAAARATKAHADLQNQLAGMARKPGAAGAVPKTAKQVLVAQKLHDTAVHSTKSVALLGDRAKKLTRISRGSLVGAAALGTAAVGVHRYDRHQGGRSHGDYGY